MAESAHFTRVWALYPKREARKDALKAWGQVDGDRHVEAITEALGWQTQSDSWRRGFVPLLASYLRGERWTDENTAEQRDPLYAQFERWQATHAADPQAALTSFADFKRYAAQRRQA